MAQSKTLRDFQKVLGGLIWVCLVTKKRRRNICDGEKYYENNDYFNAVRCYFKVASKNHVEAIYSLGYCYYHGQGVELNYIDAFKYYSRAANMGHAKALERLGVCYAEGAGVECDDDEVIRCWEQAVR